MEIDLRGAPAHTRTLSVELRDDGAERLDVRGTILDVRKRGLVPMAGDLQTAGVIHLMRVDASVDRAERRLAEPAQVGRDHATVFRQGFNLRSPHRMVQRKPMDQQHRQPGALLDVGHFCVANNDRVHHRRRS